jgi:para-aminobenzoate synthetase / 4-amino-4-deoxychorismate lyase
MGPAPWAILDFPGPDGRPTREVYRDPVTVVEARTAAEVRTALDKVEALARSGRTMVGFVAYDAAPGFEPKFEVRQGYKGPLVWFAGFVTASESEELRGPITRGVYPERSRGARDDNWIARFNPNRYRQKVSEIIEGIGRGDYYQVNLTERFSSEIHDPLAVYERIREAQMAPYCAYVETAEMAVMSVSPELFVHRSGDMIESRPMKGTSRRGRWTEEDDDLTRQLSSSEKERAENVMIVDLIRNDMGRIAVPGTVQVPSMFTVEKYPTVLQMTSHVKSQLMPETTLANVFAALFPCGSVTGAPKIASSRAIRALESEPRGVYCGAVGVVRSGGRAFTFNVAIRTVVVDRATSAATYGAGGGITADSDPDRELAELQAKAAVLTTVPRQIELLETLRLDNGVVARIEAHMRRLAGSAEFFGFRDVGRTVEKVRAEIASASRSFPNGLHRLRAVLRPDGTVAVAAHPHSVAIRPRRLALSRQPVDSGDRHLFHKLADRTLYTDRQRGAGDADDVIMVNERGELTETTIGNLVLELDGRRLTPALESGLLPGVFRATLLAAGEIEEAVLYPTDLHRATRIWMINSLREWVECRLD